MPLRNPTQLWLSLDGLGTLQEQIYRALVDRITRGDLAAGTRLPSTRALANDLDVSRTTSQAAYDQLIAEGYVDTRRGSGSFVATELPELRARVPRRTRARQPIGVRWSTYAQRIVDANLGSPFDAIQGQRPARLELLYGIPDPRLFPTADWRRAVSAHTSHMSARAIAYGPPAGMRRLRSAIRDYLSRARGIECDAEQIVIVAGTQHGLQLVTRMLCDSGSRVLIEHPWYPAARNVMLAEGVEPVSVPVDEHGANLDAVDTSTLSDCAMAYVTPSHQFPTGAVMSYRRRQQLLAWAGRTGAFVFEDDYDGEFRFRGRPVPSLRAMDDSGRVIYAGTFSKTLFPALRIGYLIVPPELVQMTCSVRWAAGWSNPTLEQAALTDFIVGGGFERHVRRTRTAYARRRAVLLDALARHLGDKVSVSGGAAGLHVLATVHEQPHGGVPALIERARDHGVGLYSMANCFEPGSERSGLVLGYSLLNPEELADAVAIIADCWDR